MATVHRIWNNGIIFSEGVGGVVEAKPRHGAKNNDVVSMRGSESDDDIDSDRIQPHDREVLLDDMQQRPQEEDGGKTQSLDVTPPRGNMILATLLTA